MKVTVNTTLAEAALENLLVAWGQQSATLASTALKLGNISLVGAHILPRRVSAHNVNRRIRALRVTRFAPILCNL